MIGLNTIPVTRCIIAHELSAGNFPFLWQVKINQFEIIYKPAVGIQLTTLVSIITLKQTITSNH